MADKAIITSIQITELSTANTLNLGHCRGYSVLVGKDTKSGELGILFEDGLQLSQEFAETNNLIRKKDKDGKNIGGYFEENRRCRAKKFMGIKSEAFWCPISYLKFTGYDLSKLKEGDLIEELNKVSICNKYYTKATQSRLNGPSRKERRGVSKFFLKHSDTSQFRHFFDKIPKGSLIVISRKLHGCAHRVAWVKDEIQLKWYHKLFKKVGIPISEFKYKYLIGSRNVILDEKSNGYYSFDFRKNASEKLFPKLKQDEIFLGELVGWEKENSPIMPSVDTKSFKDKELKKWGEKVYYTYGCPMGECDFYIYRIVNVTDSGRFFDLPWQDIKKRCIETGLKYVPELREPFIYDGNIEELCKIVEQHTEEQCVLFPNQPNEGCCIRIDSSQPQIFKSKNFYFKILEGILRENEDYCDLEEIS